MWFASFYTAIWRILCGKMRQFTRQFALYYFTFNYQPCHAHNCFISQLRWYCAIIPMDEFRNINALMVQLGRFYASISMITFTMMNVLTTQRRKHCAIISMNVSSIMDALMVQLGTSCSFDSPGLARNEPTPGKRSQGDSTPSVLSFFWENMVIMRRLMAGCAEKAQHLRRCSPQTIR